MPRRQAFGMMLEKFPQMKDLPKSDGTVVIKVVFEKGYFLDYTKGFGYRDEVSY